MNSKHDIIMLNHKIILFHEIPLELVVRRTIMILIGFLDI
jgi:hypothetical protein